MEALAGVGITMAVLNRDPRDPDPVGLVTRLGEELLPRLAAI
jgi:hypothetical protein